MNHREEIGKQLEAIRKSKNLTQEGVSRLTGLNRANISKIERGKYNVSIDILSKITDALDSRIEIVKTNPIITLTGY